MKIAVIDVNNMGFLTRVQPQVRVTFRKNCEDCGVDISVTAYQMKDKTFPSTSHVATYKAGVCSNCSWNRVHADGQDHFMDSKELILGGLTESEYQSKHGVAWNE